MTEPRQEKTFVKSITEIHQRLQLFQNLAFLAVLTSLLLAGCLGVSLLADPIVILEGREEKLSFIGKKREVVITDKEIKSIAERFIKRRYEWDQFSVEEMSDNLNPFLTSGLKEKIFSEINKNADSYRAISQYVGKISIEVDEKGNVIGVFDKILRITGKLKNDPSIIEKIPLLSEAQVMIKIVKGSVTHENPLGIYINSVLNYETH